MAETTLPEIARKLAAIDICTLSTKAEDGRIAARPMSNNGEVDRDGASFYFSQGDTAKVRQIEANPQVSLGFAGEGFWATVEGEAELIRDRAAFDAHWNPDLERWFEQGADTPGLTLVKVVAERIRWWGGEDGEGELKL